MRVVKYLNKEEIEVTPFP